jgi:DNA-binding response OmpR family regulator
VRLLIVEDDRAAVRLYDLFFQGYFPNEFDVRVAGDTREALKIAQEFEPGLVLLDHHLPGAPGITILSDLYTLSPRPYIIILTADITVSYFKSAGLVEAVIIKPMNPPEFVKMVKRLIERVKLYGQLGMDSNSPSIGQFIGRHSNRLDADYHRAPTHSSKETGS